jgi:HD-GYP domain-containing protein (c-di-GMP phosphodiesterase class II)
MRQSDINLLGMHHYQLEDNGQLVFIGANTAADQILNIDHASLIGKPIEEAFPGLIQTAIPDFYRQVAQTGDSWQGDQIMYEHGQVSGAFQVQAYQTTPGKMTAAFIEISNRIRMEVTLQKRDAILSAVAFAADQFLRSRDWRSQIQAVLQQLGEATEVSRIYLNENRIHPSGLATRQLYEWRNPDLSPKCKSPWLEDFVYAEHGFSRWVDIFQKGELVHGLINDLPDAERDLLQPIGVRSIAAAPILVDQAWWGILGFDDCLQERIFSKAELDALKAAANTIGAAIQRAQADLAWRQTSARSQALVRAAVHLNAVLDPETVAQTVCSEAAEALGAEAACIYLHDEETRALQFTSGYRMADYLTDALPSIPLTRLNLFLHKYSVPLILREDQVIEQFFGNAQFHKWPLVISWLMVHNQRLIGILNILHLDRQRELQDEDLSFLEGLAYQSALAVNNARLLASEQSRATELATLNELSMQLNNSQNVSEILQYTLQGIQGFLQADASLAVLHNESKSTLSITQANGFLAQKQGWAIPLNEDWNQFFAEKNGPFTSTGAGPENAFLPGNTFFSGLLASTGSASAIYVPLISKKDPVGLLVFARQAGKPFAKPNLRLLQTIGELAGNAVRKTQFHEDAQRRLTFLQSLRAIDNEIASSMELYPTLQIVLEEVLTQLKVDAADILSADHDTNILRLQASRGFTENKPLQSYLDHGDSYADLAALERRMVIFPDLKRQPNNIRSSQLFIQEDFNAYAAVPLFNKGRVKGVMEVFRRKEMILDQEWLEFLETLAGQAAIAIESISLFDNLQASNAELLTAYDATIEGWSSALDLRDADTEGHTQRVTELTEYLARMMGVHGEDLLHIRRGSLLHDIGKMGVPDRILHKPGPLSDDEWVVMRKHPQYAYEWLWPTAYLRPALDIPYCHHEKWDGSGYPQGLKGEDIPLKARIFSVVDVWDALSSDRPYRSRWPTDKVIDYVQEQSGTFFDPNIVPIFMDLLNDQNLIQ